MKFSQRMGLKPFSKTVQKDSLDTETRNGLWNSFMLDAVDKVYAEYDQWKRHFERRIWMDYFKLKIDAFDMSNFKTRIRNIFEKGKWFEVFDFIEFTAIVLAEFHFEISEKYKSSCNKILLNELSAFRFLGNVIAPITNDGELKEIDQVLAKSSQSMLMKGVNIHLNDALKKLSDRKNPDYRNSIKESISAVEAIAKAISNNPKDTLGGALDKIKGKIKLHQSLEKGFKSLYGYTSDSDGIRHALMDEPNCDFEDAKYMLVSSSAFINYLIVKADKAGIKL